MIRPLVTSRINDPQIRRLGWRRSGTVLGALVALAVGSALVASPAGAANSAGAIGPAAVAPMPAASRLASFDAQMISLVNGARAGAGLPAVREASGLSQLSVWWSSQMANGATGGQLQHNPNAWTMVTKYGASNRTAWAENVAKFSAGASARAVFDAYMGSAGHRANILGAGYRYIGMGTVAGNTATFNTMEFTDKVDGAPAAAPAKPKPVTPPKPAAPAPAAPAPTQPKPATSRSAAKPKPVTAKPKPAAAKPKSVAAKPATSKPQPQATKPRTLQAMAPRQPSMVPAGSAPSAVPSLVPGTLEASFGALGVPGMAIEIRDVRCEAVVAKVTTGRDGRAAVTLTPGPYCAVVTSTPHGVQRPQPTPFTVNAGQAFTIGWDSLDTDPVRWVAHTWLMRPV